MIKNNKDKQCDISTYCMMHIPNWKRTFTKCVEQITYQLNANIDPYTYLAMLRVTVI